jgi:hypothetical protein
MAGDGDDAEGDHPSDDPDSDGTHPVVVDRFDRQRLRVHAQQATTPGP